MTAIRLVYTFDDKNTTFETEKQQIVIGRAKPGVTIDLDLSPDKTVSRPHARLFHEGTRFWIEDLNSTSGTIVKGQDIRGLGRREIQPGDAIQIGNTTVVVEDPRPVEDRRTAAISAAGMAGGDITIRLDAGDVLPEAESTSDDMRERLAMLYDLPLQIGTEGRLEASLNTIVQRLVAAIPGATSGALLVKDDPTGQLLLKAHAPAEGPEVSLTQAREAMEQRQAFVWSRSTDPDVTITPQGRKAQSAMYAPLLWKNETVGVLCAASHKSLGAFTPVDLRLLLALAHYAALIVVQHRMQEELRAAANLMTRLMTNFSPKIRDRLLASARLGRMRLGGQRSEVTILITDIRDFTKVSASMDSEDIVDMLNDYFSALVDVAFRFDGTVDKFIGDAMLVVFGSPEADLQQHDKAVHAAVAMQEAIKTVSGTRATRRLPTCEMGIGVHCGEVLHGFIGSNERMEYTVIGDAVNRATRYCDAAGPREILISPELHEWVWRTALCEPITVNIKHGGTMAAFRVKAVGAPQPKQPATR